MSKPKLNPNARKWVRALRSGKYRQCKGALEKVDKDGSKFCCLGVACDLFNRDTSNEKLERTVIDGEANYDENAALLPDPVRAWLSLDSNAGHFEHKHSLADKNDRGTRFSTIADIIESQPEGLFR